MGDDGRRQRITQARRAFGLAQQAGSPVASARGDVVEFAVRRWESFERRNPTVGGSERQARIEDLANAFADRWDGSPSAAGPMMSDYRWLAAQICDALCFILPEGSTGWSTPRHDASVSDAAVERLRHAASPAGLRVVKEPSDDGSLDQTCDLYRLTGWGPLWALLHRAVPIFAFTNQPPDEADLEAAAFVIDAPIDIGPVVSIDWRYLSADIAKQRVTSAHFVDLNDGDRNTIARTRPKTVAAVLFAARGS